jgi:hypothetical protein
MWDGALDAWDREEVLLGFFNTLGNSGWNFLSLAVSNTDAAFAVAYNYKCGEAEATTTLNHLGNAVDGDDALNKSALFYWGGITTLVTTIAAFATFAACATLTINSHYGSYFLLVALERQAALAGAICQGRDTAVILVTAAVENDCVDASCLCALRKKLANFSCFGALVASRTAKIFFHG